MTNEEARNLENEVAEEELAKYRAMMEAAADVLAEIPSHAELIRREITRTENVMYRYMVHVIGTVRGTRNMADVPEYFYTLEDITLMARTFTASQF